MYLIDSNIIIYSANPAYSFLRPYLTDNYNAVSSLSVIEVLGYHKLDALDKKYFEAIFKVVPIIHLNDRIAQQAVVIRQSHNISLADSVIAATTIFAEAKLLTRNIDDFKHIKGLKLHNPFDR